MENKTIRELKDSIEENNLIIDCITGKPSEAEAKAYYDRSRDTYLLTLAEGKGEEEALRLADDLMSEIEGYGPEYTPYYAQFLEEVIPQFMWARRWVETSLILAGNYSRLKNIADLYFESAQSESDLNLAKKYYLLMLERHENEAYAASHLLSIYQAIPSEALAEELSEALKDEESYNYAQCMAYVARYSPKSYGFKYEALALSQDLTPSEKLIMQSIIHGE